MRRLFVLLAVVALVASACVGTSGTEADSDAADRTADGALASAAASTDDEPTEAGVESGDDGSDADANAAEAGGEAESATADENENENDATDPAGDDAAGEGDATAETAAPAPASNAPPPPPSPGGVRPAVAPGDYIEAFDNAESLSRLDFFVANGRDYNNRPTSWPADHATGGDCGGPFTERTVSWPDPDDDDLRTTTSDPGETAYWCAPGGEGTGHLMTSFFTKGYAHLDFSPKQTFTDVRRVCWDANATNLGNRKWIQVAVVDATLADDVAPRLDWTRPAFLENGPGSRGLHVVDGVFLFSTTQGGANVKTGGGAEAKGGKTDKSVSDTKKRVTTCLVDRGSGEIEIIQERWSGAIDTTMLPGAFPRGEVKVVFQDLSYNPDKAENESPPMFKGYTWHWDNLYVSSEAGGSVG